MVREQGFPSRGLRVAGCMDHGLKSAVQYSTVQCSAVQEARAFVSLVAVVEREVA